ncbi:MAG: aminoacyl-tRNA hydrolase [Candidatus Kapabacteria bacterium]|nr:aminoacyl-tRNA hydrolase [Candidatus Kapabacteria bacterium]
MNFDWLIIALGNPGKKYSQTRHNIGWMVGFELCQKQNTQLNTESTIYYTSRLRFGSNNVLIVFPTTYMNNSGEAVRKVHQKYGIPIDRMIVVADEYNFPLGKVHLKKGGSDGGHNGIASIIEELQSEDFYRLRCGIGPKPKDIILTDFVLSEFKEDEKDMLKETIKKAVEALEHFFKHIPERAMSDINSGKLWKEEPEKE